MPVAGHSPATWAGNQTGRRFSIRIVCVPFPLWIKFLLYKKRKFCEVWLTAWIFAIKLPLRKDEKSVL
jgi:hypothetical protein